MRKLNSAGLRIINTKSTFEKNKIYIFIYIFSRSVDFTLHKEAIPQSKIGNILRFQDNKGKNWGPKSKAKGSISSHKAGFVNS